MQTRLGRTTAAASTASARRNFGRPAAKPKPNPPTSKAAVRRKGFGYGVEVTTDLGLLSMPSSVGQFGWYGAATTYCQIALAPHLPFNQHKFFAKFQTGYYQAMK